VYKSALRGSKSCGLFLDVALFLGVANWDEGIAAEGSII